MMQKEIEQDLAILAWYLIIQEEGFFLFFFERICTGRKIMQFMHHAEHASTMHKTMQECIEQPLNS